MSYIAIRKLYYIASISNIVVIKSTLSINPFDRGISSTVIRTLTNCEFCKDLEIYTISIWEIENVSNRFQLEPKLH